MVLGKAANELLHVNIKCNIWNESGVHIKLPSTMAHSTLVEVDVDMKIWSKTHTYMYILEMNLSYPKADWIGVDSASERSYILLTTLTTPTTSKSNTRHKCVLQCVFHTSKDLLSI